MKFEDRLYREKYNEWSKSSEKLGKNKNEIISILHKWSVLKSCTIKKSHFQKEIIKMSDNFENRAWINKEKTLKMTADRGK